MFTFVKGQFIKEKVLNCNNKLDTLWIEIISSKQSKQNDNWWYSSYNNKHFPFIQLPVEILLFVLLFFLFSCPDFFTIVKIIDLFRHTFYIVFLRLYLSPWIKAHVHWSVILNTCCSRSGSTKPPSRHNKEIYIYLF